MIVCKISLGLLRLGLGFGSGFILYMHEMTIPINTEIIKRCITSNFIGLRRSDRLHELF